jgi:N-methylhydantoinase B
MSTLDPITIEVVRNKLDGIANEMQSTLLRSSFSPIVKEGLDASASLFTINGETLSQALAVPIHLATLIPVIRALLDTYPLETVKEGDIYILNDPYLGGTHLPDIALMMPIFHDGKPIALSAAMTHHQDVGGMTPGSVPTAQAARWRCDERYLHADDAPERADAGLVRRRSQCADRGVHRRRATPCQSR